jgi:predicted porin
MKMTQMVLGVAGALIASTAMAQTANPVTLYGRVYAMFESVEADGGATPVARRNRVSNRLSLIGVRGTEDLGGGLKAFFQLETDFSPDSASGAFATRNSGVGIQSSWGSVIMGRWDTPFKAAHAAIVDPFENNSLADITGVTLNQGNFSRREPNSVQYWSPNWNGFSMRAHYSANEGKTAVANPYLYSVSATYRAGNLYASYAWEKHFDQNGATVAAGIDEEGNVVSASYILRSVKLFGQYGEYKKTSTKTQKSYLAGASWTLGKHVLLGSYQNSKNGGATTAAQQPECDLVGVGYRYDFTKRTSLVAEYVKVSNDVGNLCNFGTIPLTITAGQDPVGIAIGARHVF